MTFIEKLNKLYQDNIWRADKRKEAWQKSFDKEVDKAVKYFLKESELRAKQGYKNFYVHEINLSWSGKVLSKAISILEKDHGLKFGEEGHYIIVEGWA